MIKKFYLILINTKKIPRTYAHNAIGRSVDVLKNFWDVQITAARYLGSRVERIFAFR